MKEDNKSISSKVLSVALASELMMPVSAQADFNNKDYLEQQAKYHAQQQELMLARVNLSNELYDKVYNDYCDNEVIEINGIQVAIKDLYIEYGYIDDKMVVYLIDYRKPNYDILTMKEKDANYNRRKIILLKYSKVFYDYYSNKAKSLIEYLNGFDGSINYNVPETYFDNPTFRKK